MQFEAARYVLNLWIEGADFGSMRSYYMETIKRQISGTEKVHDVSEELI